DEPAWEAVARAIAAMHRAGVWHADLNAFNRQDFWQRLEPAYRAAWARGTARA
ncbi:lipopolysaccharide kinase InaA family protein, partial [Bordetella pertussis]|uniref:lipopolysaccharide kinase InaA family protein n=1 Tax=Bordetella pertussis TaxID=520 RepID=UPI000A72A008